MNVTFNNSIVLIPVGASNKTAPVVRDFLAASRALQGTIAGALYVSDRPAGTKDTRELLLDGSKIDLRILADARDASSWLKGVLPNSYQEGFLTQCTELADEVVDRMLSVAAGDDFDYRAGISIVKGETLEINEGPGGHLQSLLCFLGGSIPEIVRPLAKSLPDSAMPMGYGAGVVAGLMVYLDEPDTEDALQPYTPVVMQITLPQNVEPNQASLVYLASQELLDIDTFALELDRWLTVDRRL